MKPLYKLAIHQSATLDAIQLLIAKMIEHKPKDMKNASDLMMNIAKDTAATDTAAGLSLCFLWFQNHPPHC